MPRATLSQQPGSHVGNFAVLDGGVRHAGADDERIPVERRAAELVEPGNIDHVAGLRQPQIEQWTERLPSRHDARIRRQLIECADGVRERSRDNDMQIARASSVSRDGRA